MAPLNCFKAYDIRGRVPDELNDDVATRIGRAYARVRPARRLWSSAQDMRLSSPALADALARGLNAGGADVLRIGMCGTEEVYFATSHLKAGGGIMVTASHNPADWNGMKLVREGSRPISGDTGLNEIRALAESGRFAPVASARHAALPLRPLPPTWTTCSSYVDASTLRPLKVVVNAGNGGAGHVIDGLESAPAVHLHQAAARAGWHLSPRRAQPAAAGEPAADERCRARPRGRPWRCLGRRLRPLLPL